MFKRLLLVLFVWSLFLTVAAPSRTTTANAAHGAAAVLTQVEVATPVVSFAPVHVNEATQEDTVYITRTGAKYHRDGCQYLSRSKIAIKRKDAIRRGFEPCKVCKP